MYILIKGDSAIAAIDTMQWGGGGGQLERLGKPHEPQCVLGVDKARAQLIVA